MKYKIVIILTFVTFSFSCKKEFLNQVPSSTITPTTFYKTQNDFQQAVNGIYAPLHDLYGVSTSDRPGSGAWIMGEMRSDNTIYIYNSGNRGFADAENHDNFLDDALSGITAVKYNTNYNIIGRANQVLSLIDQVTFDSKVRDNLKGQALFLRAFAYFDLVQYFGDVPLTTKPVTNLAQTFLNRTSKDSVYAQIVADATQAITLLPKKSTQTVGAATMGSAQTLLANVDIVLKKWSDAENVLKAVVSSNEYALLSSYSSVFRTSNKNSKESVFEIQFMQGATAGLQSNFIYNFLPRLPDPGVVTGVFGQSNPQGGWNTPTSDLIASYEAGDTRKAGSISYVNGYPFINKYLNPHSLFNNTDDDWPVYRYSEVLLFLAEALNEQGKSTEALTYLNMVRDRAFGAGVSTIISTDQTTLRTAIFHERRVELAFENKRWLDLVRSGTAIAVMNAQGAAIKANPTLYYFPAGITLSGAAYNVDAHRLLYPIPVTEIQINPALKQNPGY